MFKGFFKQVADTLLLEQEQAPDPQERENAIRLATAVLMVEVARADAQFDEAEFELLLKLCSAHFHLSAQEATELTNLAGETAEEAASLHDFTQLLQDNLDEREKSRVVELLWRVAYADGRLDKYENSLVLKISDLLYVSRGLVMRLKHDAATAAGGA